MNKKTLYILIAISCISVLGSLYFLFAKTKSKDFIITIDKLLLGYSSYIIDIGDSPKSIKDLYKDNNNPDWKGPYVNSDIIDSYKKGPITLKRAASMPTKGCSIDGYRDCYIWIILNNFSTSDFNNIKEEINKNTKIFYAEKKFYIRTTISE